MLNVSVKRGAQVSDHNNGREALPPMEIRSNLDLSVDI